jgi:hypothetical protein
MEGERSQHGSDERGETSAERVQVDLVDKSTERVQLDLVDMDLVDKSTESHPEGVQVGHCGRVLDGAVREEGLDMDVAAVDVTVDVAARALHHQVRPLVPLLSPRFSPRTSGAASNVHLLSPCISTRIGATSPDSAVVNSTNSTSSSLWIRSPRRPWGTSLLKSI